MITKFEDIIKDYHNRNSHLIRKSVFIFLGFFVFFNLGMIITYFIVPIPHENIEAWRKWKPTPKFYIFALLDYIMLYLWLWLHLNFKLIQSKADFLSDYVSAEYVEINASKPSLFTPWTDLIKNSPLPKRMGMKIYWAMLALLILFRIMSFGRQSLNIILLSALIAYELTAVLKGQLIEKYLLLLRLNYVDKAETIPIPEEPEIVRKSLSQGLILGTLVTGITCLLFQFSDFTNAIFFFFAFSGICVSILFLKGVNKCFKQIIIFVDSVRSQQNTNQSPELKRI
jgi:hypothetical protein